MKFSPLLVVVSLVSFGASLAIAQDSTRLRFEVVKDGATVAIPKSPSRRVRPQHLKSPMSAASRSRQRCAVQTV